MGIEITAKPVATSMRLHRPSPSLNKQTEIVKMLTHCSLRRGAPQNAASLFIYAQDLSTFELDVIAAVLEKFGAEVPEEYKPAWPAVGIFSEMIRSYLRSRRATAAAKEKAAADEVYRAKAQREMEEDKANPAEWEAKINAAADRLKLGRKKEVVLPQYDEVRCPHCAEVLPLSTNMRLFSREEVRQLADTLDELAAIAERNRNMPMEDVIEEVIND